MKILLITFGLILGSVAPTLAQQIKAKSEAFTYTYGLNRYLSAEQFQTLPTVILERYRKELLKDLGQRPELFVVRGEFETELDHKRRREKAELFKQEILRSYRKRLLFHGSLAMSVKISQQVQQNYMYLLRGMLDK